MNQILLKKGIKSQERIQKIESDHLSGLVSTLIDYHRLLT